MFTGLIEALGEVAALVPEGESAVRLQVSVPQAWAAEAQQGESVAINGCCLTLVAHTGDLWSFQAGAETLSKTSLGGLRRGDRVNLERSLPVNGRLGGHFVQGHVDGTGTVEQIDKDGEWVTMWFSVPEPLLPQMVQKGSIAVDGISLTIVTIVKNRFSVALIPHTLSVTTLGLRKLGDRVNLETDILGKYVEQLMRK
ncbi:MAG: riboflavin synthase [Planctomycetales bacterium]